MAMSVSELRKWVFTLEEGNTVAVDDGGLLLQAALAAQEFVDLARQFFGHAGAIVNEQLGHALRVGQQRQQGGGMGWNESNNGPGRQGFGGGTGGNTGGGFGDDLDDDIPFAPEFR